MVGPSARGRPEPIGSHRITSHRIASHRMTSRGMPNRCWNFPSRNPRFARGLSPPGGEKSPPFLCACLYVTMPRWDPFERSVTSPFGPAFRRVAGMMGSTLGSRLPRVSPPYDWPRPWRPSRRKGAARDAGVSSTGALVGQAAFEPKTAPACRSSDKWNLSTPVCHLLASWR